MKRLLVAGVLATLALGHPEVGTGGESEQRRFATVRDGIEMSQLAFPEYDSNGAPACGMGTDYGPVGNLSPDDRRLVIVTRRGDLRLGVSAYKMLLWEKRKRRLWEPSDIAEMDSSSLEPGIDPASVSWTADGLALTFLGELPRRREQVYQLSVESRAIHALTNSAQSIIGYSRSADGSSLAYETFEERTEELWNASTLRHGLTVTTQSLLGVTSGQRTYDLTFRVFVKDRKGLRQISPMPGSHFRAIPYWDSEKMISMSPDGRYIVVPETVPNDEAHPAWRLYSDPLVRFFIQAMGHSSGDTESLRWGWFQRYVLINAITGRSRVLFDSPLVGWVRPIVWSPDGGSVVISHTLSPVAEAAAAKSVHKAEKSARSAVEIDIHTGSVTPIGQSCDQALSWTGKRLVCSTAQFSYEKTFAYQVYHEPEGDNRCHPTEWVIFKKVRQKWQTTGREPPAVDVYQKEGRNVPPKLYYRMRGQSNGNLLVDLNPGFVHLNLATERLVSWEWSKGHVITAGLYYPPNYQHGKRYPLVIQTHGFDPHADRFNFWGSSTTSDAAQVLAGRGMLVLQVGDGDSGAASARGGQRAEVERAVDIYRSAIAYLSGKNMIDPARVGIIGWSHTCFFVKWALTHDPQLFAAASVAEGGDGSDMQYMLDLQSSVANDTLYTGPPFGATLKSWIKLSPVFNIDRVRAPLFLVVLHNELAIYEWEWLRGLRGLKRPVEMLVLDGRTHDGHDLQEPWDIEAVSGENVDWFDFWLNNHEDPDPAKAGQYTRWKHLRALHRQERGQPAESPITWSSVE